MQGRQYDGAGNMRNWWRNDTLLAYKERIKCIETEYSNLTTDTGEHINGLQTLGENIADNGGLKAAFRAFTSLKEEDRTWSRGRLPGLNLTENQLFFLSFAQVRNSRNPGRNCNNGFLIYLLSNIYRVTCVRFGATCPPPSPSTSPRWRTRTARRGCACSAPSPTRRTSRRSSSARPAPR